MSTENTGLHRQLELRSRAVASLSGGSNPTEQRLTASAAFAVLHSLASSPATAADAIALLHELQVHQVELDLQYEELKNANLSLEADLHRQTQLYDYAPVALCTLDAGTQLLEMNLAAARLLGQERHELLGQALQNYLTQGSKAALKALLQQAHGAPGCHARAIELVLHGQIPVLVHASVTADPLGDRFMVALNLDPGN